MERSQKKGDFKRGTKRGIEENAEEIIYSSKIFSSPVQKVTEEPCSLKSSVRESKNTAQKADLEETEGGEEVVLEDDAPKTTDQHPGVLTSRSPTRSGRPRVLPRTKEPLTIELSEYEKIRASNIAEREEMLASLGIHSELKQLKQGLGLAKRVRREGVGEEVEEEEKGERRRSLRTANARKGRDDDEDWTPSYRERKEEDDDYAKEEDFGNHTHHGLRRHPCKECPNCLLKDCRKCIFCRFISFPVFAMQVFVFLVH